jgi:hypothetical protein
VRSSVRRSTAIGGGALLAAFLIAGCGGTAATPPVGEVIVQTTELSLPLEEAGLDLSTTAALTTDALAAAGMRIRKGARHSYTARLEVVSFSSASRPGGGPPLAEIVVELELAPDWSVGPVARRTGRATAHLVGADPRSGWRQALRAAVADAAPNAFLDVQAQARSTEALRGDLSAGDPATRERAIRVLASRGSGAVARAIAEHVRDPDSDVARAALDALVALREPNTVLALIDAAQAGGASTTLRLIPILAEIGGPDVEGYLLTLESGHADPAVREAAAEARSKTIGVGRPATPVAPPGGFGAKMRRP